MDRPIPFIDLSRYEDGLLESLLPRIEKLLVHNQFVGGPECEDFEKRLARYCASHFALGCANGTDALQIALRALDIGPGDNVLMPDLNFWAAFEAVVNVGATPVTIDVSPTTLHLDPDLMEEALDQLRPQAVILVHLYGWACPDTQRIRQACEKRGVRLIEDCAQSIGTRFQGQPLIGSAQLATTSFYPAKVLGASGDAGALLVADAGLAERIKSLRNHGRREHYLYGQVGWNSRLGAYEACYLNLALDHLDARIASRRKAVETYRRELGPRTPLELMDPGPDVRENGYLSVLLCETAAQREALIEHLRKNHIGHGIVYPVPLSHQPAARAHLDQSLDRGVSADISARILSLPCFAHIRDDELERVCAVVRDFF